MQKADDATFDIQTTHDLKRDLLLELKKRHFRSLPSDDIRSLDTGRGPKMIRASGPEGAPGKRDSLVGDLPVGTSPNKPTLSDGWNAVVAKQNDMNIINGNLGNTTRPARRRSLSSSSSDSSSPSSPRSRPSSHQRSPVSPRPGSAAVRRTLSNVSLSSSLSTSQRKQSMDSTVGSAPPLIPPSKGFLERKASAASSTSSAKASEQFTLPLPPPPPPFLSFNNTVSSDIHPSALDENKDRKSSSSSSSSDSSPPSPSTSVRSGKSSLQDLPLPSPPPQFPPSPSPDSPVDSAAHSQFPLPSPPPNFPTLQMSTHIPSNPSSSSLLLPPDNELDRKSSMSPSEVMGIFDAALDDHPSFSVSPHNDTPHEDHPAYRFTGATALERTGEDLTQSQQNTAVRDDRSSSTHESGTHNEQYGYVLDQSISMPVSKEDKESESILDKDATRRHSYGEQGVRVEIEERSPTSKGIRRKRPQSVALTVTKLRPDVRTVRQQIKPGTVDSLASLFTNMKHQYSVTSPTKEKVDFDLNLQQRLLELETLEKKNEENTSPRDKQYSSSDLNVPSINFPSELTVPSGLTVPSESNMMFGEVESRTSSRSNSTASNDSGHKRWRAKLKITDTNMSGTSRSSSEDSINDVPESRTPMSGGKISRSSSKLSLDRKPDLTVSHSGGNLSRSSSDSSINLKTGLTVAKSGDNLSRTSSDNSIHLKTGLTVAKSGDNLSRSSSDSSINLKTGLTVKKSGDNLSRSSSDNSITLKTALNATKSGGNLSRSSSDNSINLKKNIKAVQPGDNLSDSSRSSSDNDVNRKSSQQATQYGHNLRRSSSENSTDQKHELKDILSESKLSLSSRSSPENTINVKPILQPTQSEGNLPAGTDFYSSRAESNLTKTSSLDKLNSSPGFDFLTASREIIRQINSRNSSRNSSLRRTDYHVEPSKGIAAPIHLEEDANLQTSPVIGSEISTNFIIPSTHHLETSGDDEISTLAASENESKQTEAELLASFSNIEQGERLHTADSRPQSQHGLGTQDTGNDSSETRFGLPVRGHVSETRSTATGNILEAKTSEGPGLPMFSSGFGKNEYMGEYSYDPVHGANSPAYLSPPPPSDMSGEVEHTFKSHTADRIITDDSAVYNNTTAPYTGATNDINAEEPHTEQTGLQGGEVGQGFELSMNSSGPAHTYRSHDSSHSESDHSTGSSRSHSPSTHEGAVLKSDVIMIDSHHETPSAGRSRDHSISSSEKSDAGGAGPLKKNEVISDSSAEKAVSEFLSILDFDSNKSHSSSSSSSSSSDAEDDNHPTKGEVPRHSIDKKEEVLVEPSTHDEAQATGQPGLHTTQVEVTQPGLFAHHISHVHETGEWGAGGGGDEGDDRPEVTTVASPSAHPSTEEEDSRRTGDSEPGVETGDTHQTSEDFLSILDDINIDTDLTSNFLGKNRFSGVYSKEEKVNEDRGDEEDSLREKSDHGSGKKSDHSSSDSDSSDDGKSDKKSQSYTVNRESLISDSQTVRDEHVQVVHSHDHLTHKASIARSDSSRSDRRHSDSSHSDTSEDNKSEKRSQSYNVTGESVTSHTRTAHDKHEEIFPSHSQLTPKSSVARSDSDSSDADKSEKNSQSYTVNGESVVSDSHTVIHQREDEFHSHHQLTPKASITRSDSSDSGSSEDNKSDKNSHSYTVNAESVISHTQSAPHQHEETFPPQLRVSPKSSIARSVSSDSDSSHGDKHERSSQSNKVSAETLIYDDHSVKIQREEISTSDQLTQKSSIARSDSSNSDKSDSDKSDSDKSDSDKSDQEKNLKKSQDYTIHSESLISGTLPDHNKHEEKVNPHAQLTPKSSTSSLNLHSLRQQTSSLDEAIRQQHKLLSPKPSDPTEKFLDSSFSDARSSRGSVSSVKSGLQTNGKETSFNSKFFNLSVSSEGSDDGRAKTSVEDSRDNEKGDETAWPVLWSSHKQASGFLKQTGNPDTKNGSVSQRSSLSSSQNSLTNIHKEDIFRQNPLRSSTSSSSSSSSSSASQTSVSNTGIVDKAKEEFHVPKSDGNSRKSSLSQKPSVRSRLHSSSSDKEEIVKAIDENELLTKSEFQKRRENFERLRLEREKQSNLNGAKTPAEGKKPLRTFGRIEESTSFQAVKNSLVPRDYKPPAVVDIKKPGTGQAAAGVGRVSVEPPQIDVRASALPNVHTSLKPRADSVDEYRSDSSTSSSDDSIDSKNKNLRETKDKLSQFLRDFQKGNQKSGSGKVKEKSNAAFDSHKNEKSESVFPPLISFDSDGEDSREIKESRRKFEEVKTEYIHKNGKLNRSASSSSDSSSSDSDSNEKMAAIVGEVSTFGIRKEMTSHDETSSVTHETHSNEGSHSSPLHQDNSGSDIYLFQRPQGDVYVLQEVLPHQRESGENLNAHVLSAPDLDGAHVIFNNSGTVSASYHDGYHTSGTTDLIVDSSAIEDDAARDVIAAFLDAQELSKKRQSHSSAQLNHDSTIHTHSRGAGEVSGFSDNTGGLPMHNGGVDHNSASSLPTSSPGVVVVHHKTEYTDSQTENSSVYNQAAPHNNIYDSYHDQQSAGNSNRVHDSSRIVVDNSGAWASPETERVSNESRRDGAHPNSIVVNSTDVHHQNRYQVNHWQDSTGPSGFVLITPTAHTQPLMVNVNDGHSMVNPYQSTPITVTTTTQAIVGEKVDMKIDFSPPARAPETPSSSSSDDESVTRRYVVKSAPQKSSLKKSSRYDSDAHDSSTEFVYNKTDTLTANVRVGGQSRDVILKPYDLDTSYTPRYVSRSETQSPNSTDGSLYQKRTRGPSHSLNTSYSSTYVTSPPRENQTYFTYDPHSRASRNPDTRSGGLTSARSLSRSVPESLHVIGSPRRSRESTHDEKSYRVVSGSKKHHSPERFFKNPTLSLRRDDYEVKGYSSGEESEPKQYRTVTKLFLNGDKPRSPSPTNVQYKITSHQSQDTLDKQRDKKLDNGSSFYEVRKVKPSGRGGSSSDDSEPSSPFKKEQKRYRVLGTSDSALNRPGPGLTSPGFNSSHEKSFEEATITRTEQVVPSRLHSVPPSTKTHRTVIQLEVDRDKKFKEKHKTEEDFVDSRYMIKNTKSDDDFHSKNLFKVSGAPTSSETLWRTGRAKSMESLNGRLVGDYDPDPRTDLGTSPRMVKTMKQKEGNRLYVINSTVSDSGGERRNQNPPGWFKSTIDINENYPEARDRNTKQSRDLFTSSQSLNDERTSSNSYTTERSVYYVREKAPTHRTRSSEFISPDSGQGTEVASSDGENDSRHKFERVERIYEVRTEPQIPEHLSSTEDLHNDLRVLRGKILIQNRLDGSEHDEDDFDENANLFDSSFHLGKDNPLYSSDPDIMASLQREEQAELSRHVHQDITFETVDRIAQKYKGDKGQELSPKPRRKQNLSALLLSKLASVDSKDIRQTIDVEHHNEEIYGDIDFIHADGQRSASRNTSNFDSVNEKVELTLTQGKAYVIIKVIAERIVPTDYEFNVWRKSQAIVTRQIEIDLLANEQRRRLYQHVMESASSAGYLEEGGSRRRHHPFDQADGLSPQERQLSSMETLKLFSQILDVAEGQGDIDHTNVRTKQEMGQLPASAADLLY